MFEEIKPGVFRLPDHVPRDTSKDEVLVTITPKERKARDKWVLRHKDACREWTGFYYKVSCAPGLGMGISIGCEGCLEEYDITEYEAW